MAQQVDIPGLGIVEFPDGMSDDDIASAIKKNIMPTLPATSTASSVGRTLAGFADSVVGGPASVANMIGYAGARALGRSPEEAKKAEVFETQPLAKAFGVGNSPEYRSEATQRLGAFVGENVGKGAEWISKQTGLPVADVENMINTLGMGAGVKAAPLANKAIGAAGAATEKAAVGTGKAAAKGAKAVAALPGDITKGALNAARSDLPVSSLKISDKTLNQATDAASHASGKAAVGPLGELAIRASGNEVPIQGRVVENMAETAARGYKDMFNDRRSGIYGGAQGMADIAGLFGVGIPFQGSLMRAGIPAALKAVNPLRAVDPADMRGVTVGGKPATFDIFSGKNTDYIQSAGVENMGRRTYGRTVDETPFKEAPKPAPKPAGPAPVLALGHNGKTSLRNRKPEVKESTAPIYASESGIAGTNLSAVDDALFNQKYAPQPVEGYAQPALLPDAVPEPVAPSAPKVFEQSREERLDALKQKMLERGIVPEEKGPGKREANAANKQSKEENLKKTIAEWNNADSPVRNIDTQPVDTTDMDNATRGIYNKLKPNGNYDSIPSPEWLKEHGITEQTFIRRSIGAKRNPSPVAPKTSNPTPKPKPTLIDLESITPESSVAESLGVPPSMIQPKINLNSKLKSVGLNEAKIKKLMDEPHIIKNDYEKIKTLMTDEEFKQQMKDKGKTSINVKDTKDTLIQYALGDDAKFKLEPDFKLKSLRLYHYPDSTGKMINGAPISAQGTYNGVSATINFKGASKGQKYDIIDDSTGKVIKQV
jgi:hypothetical protein